MTDIAMFICSGLKGMHEPSARAAFLEDVWVNREQVWRWQSDTFGGLFRNDALPVFLHGGDSSDKIVIAGLNPGWREAPDRSIERFIQESPRNYRDFHDRFFELYPQFFTPPVKMSPFWANLASKLAAMLSETALPANRWRAYAQVCVAQDIVPFHSHHRETVASDLGIGSPLGQLAQATIEGLSASNARQVWMFSPEGYRSVCDHVASRAGVDGRRFSVSGCTKTSRHVEISAVIALLPRPHRPEPLPVLAVDNALISQPRFPFDACYCTDRCPQRQRETFAQQLTREVLAATR